MYRIIFIILFLYKMITQSIAISHRTTFMYEYNIYALVCVMYIVDTYLQMVNAMIL